MSRQKETRCLGLIGGLGPGATVYYYRELVGALAAQSRVPRLLIAHADIARIYAFVAAKDFDGLARYLAEIAASLAAGGAEFTAMVAATPHICADKLEALSPIPLINMLSEVANAVQARGLTRVALLGTRYTLETRLFSALRGIDVILPAPDEIDIINRNYMDIVAGRGSTAQIDELRKLAQTFIARDGAQVVLIAGTDLSDVFTEANAGFPMLDCARIHIDAIVRRMVG